MNYHGLVKRLDLPAGWIPPAKLEYDDIRARAISRADNDDDVRGINASVELIRRTRGGSWPTGPVSADFNYVDEVWHECEFREGGSFTYAVYDSCGQYLGCCYLYPVGRRTPLTEELLTYDVDVSVAGLQLIGFDGHLTMMSLETYMKMYAPVSDGSSSDAVITAADEFLKNLPHEGPQIG